MENSTTFSAPFLRYLLSPKTKVLRSRISFGVKKTNIDNQYGLFSIELEDGSSMIEVVEFTVSYAPVAGIRSLCIIIAISYAEGLILLSWTSPIRFGILSYPTLQKQSIWDYQIYIWTGTKENGQNIN